MRMSKKNRYALLFCFVFCLICKNVTNAAQEEKDSTIDYSDLQQVSVPESWDLKKITVMFKTPSPGSQDGQRSSLPILFVNQVDSLLNVSGEISLDVEIDPKIASVDNLKLEFTLLFENLGIVESWVKSDLIRENLEPKKESEDKNSGLPASEPKVSRRVTTSHKEKIIFEIPNTRLPKSSGQFKIPFDFWVKPGVLKQGSVYRLRFSEEIPHDSKNSGLIYTGYTPFSFNDHVWPWLRTVLNFLFG